MQSACAILYFHLACPALPYCPHYLKKGAIFGKRLLKIKCVFLFSLKFWSQTFLILRIIEPNIIINVRGSSCKYPLFMSDFLNLGFFRKVFEKHSYIKFHKNPSTGSPTAPSGRTGGQTDMMKLVVAFCNFAKGPKNEVREDKHTGLFISPSGTSILDCATTKTCTAERNISIGRESLKVLFCTRGLGVVAGSTARG